MDIRDAITLIKHVDYTTTPQSIWADLGCGAGLFTYALANLLAPGSTIYAWDKGTTPLSPLPKPHHINIKPRQLDFLKNDLPVSGLDGILMANSLHYVQDKPPFIEKVSTHLQEQGAFLIVEYETTRANPWVPYPIPFHALKTLFHEAGFISAVKLQERPSVYGSAQMYAALFKR
ncbi:class I SAM-dependent methyltransferase [Chitinophaga sp.]|uniref:class I SAM-dependent methyltransferase n=1 Tax=Chitinophaga sp. TaxID=1869181 RepID=UPI002F92D15E